MIISSLIKDNHAKDLVKLLSGDNKQIIYLISVGQPYHEDEHLTASVRLMYELIHSCANTEANRGADPNVSQRLHAPWTITVIVADTLQAYNHAQDEDTLKAQREIWNQKGDEWLRKYKACFQNLVSAGQGRIQVEVQFIKWSQLLATAKKQYHFSEYFQEISKSYQEGTKSSLFLWTNHKSHRHTHHKSNPSEPASRELQEKWKKTAIDNPYKLQYILEELAVLLGSISEGLLLTEREKTPPGLTNSVCSLVYPSNEEEVFRHARNLLKEFARQKQFQYQHPFVWQQIHLTASEDPSFLLISHSDEQPTADEAGTLHRKINQTMIERVYFELPEDQAQEYNAAFPKWSSENYYENRHDYRSLCRQALSELMILQGGAGTGKASLVREICHKHESSFTKKIWLERDNNKDPYLAAVTTTAKQYKLIDQLSKPDEVKATFNRFLRDNPRTFLVFKGARHFSEIAAFLPRSECFVFVTTQAQDFNAGINKLASSVSFFNVHPFSVAEKEAQRYIAKAVGDGEDPVFVDKICHSLGYLPGLLHAAVQLYQEQRIANPDYTLKQFYKRISECGVTDNYPLTKKSQMLWRQTIQFIEAEESKLFQNSVVRSVLEIWSFLADKINIHLFLPLLTQDTAENLNHLNYVFSSLTRFSLISYGPTPDEYVNTEALKSLIRQELILRKNNRKYTISASDFGENLKEWLRSTLSLAARTDDPLQHLVALRSYVSNMNDMDDFMLEVDNYIPDTHSVLELLSVITPDLDTQKLKRDYQVARKLMNSNEKDQAYTLLKIILIHENEWNDCEFWANVYYLCFTYSIHYDYQTEAIKEIEKCISYSQHLKTRDSFKHKIEYLLFTSNENEHQLFQILQLIQKYCEVYSKDLSSDCLLVHMLFRAGIHFVQRNPIYAEPFFLRALDIFKSYWGSAEHIHLSPVLNQLSKVYYQLENFDLAQYYAKQALIISYEKNDWSPFANRVSESFVNYYLASSKLNKFELMQQCFYTMVNFSKLVMARYPNADLSDAFLDLLRSIRENGLYPECTDHVMSIDKLATKTDLTLPEDHCPAAKEKMAKLANSQNVIIYKHSGFFSPSKHATAQEPFGPYADYYCALNDELTDLSTVINYFCK